MVRDQFLSELDPARLHDLADLNARLWAWLETVYHRRAHRGLEGRTPLERWQQDLLQVRPLGRFAPQLDQLFHHRHRRKVRKDGTVAFAGGRFEVPYELAGRELVLVVDPHREQVLRVESETGEALGPATALDAVANNRRTRSRGAASAATQPAQAPAINAVELALECQQSLLLGEVR